MLPRNSEHIERREVSRLVPRFHIELSADASYEFRPSAFRGKHPRQKKQIARLHGFRIHAKRLRGRWELNTELGETVLGGRYVGGHDEYSCQLPAAEMSAAIDVQDVTSDRRGVSQEQ